MRRRLCLDDVECAVLGGSVFACGGGGWADHGRELGRLAVTIGRPEIVSIDEIDDNEWIATAAAIGAPAGSTAWQMLGSDYVRAVELLVEKLGEPLSGLIIGQNGMSSTLNAWLPAALLNLVVVDAVGDMRAHPTGDMGSLGMASNPQSTIQTAAGGNRDQGRYLELVICGQTQCASPVLRAAADQAGGFIASCRNPVRAFVVREKAAAGGITRAMNLGRHIIDARPRGPAQVIDAICSSTGGSIIMTGRVAKRELIYTSEAFDIGYIEILGCDGVYSIRVMNEFMTVEHRGVRLACYPDVITVLDSLGDPVSAGRCAPGMEVSLLRVPFELLPLARGVLDPNIYPIVEKSLGVSFVDEILFRAERMLHG